MMNQWNRCATAAALVLTAASPAVAEDPIQVGFLWHMHQPQYIPALDPFGADPFFSYSVPDIHNQRLGPYTNWPANAVNAGSFLPHLGAHVSFSGSLMSNLDALAASGIHGGQWSNWYSTYRAEQTSFPASNMTALGNPRLEMIGFGYHHPLMPLLDDRSIRLQIKLHKIVHAQTWQTGYSQGMFPPETAFSTRIIPALVAEGIDWVLVDNIHFDRASQGYPHNDATGIARPNRADQINPDPSLNGGRWVQLQNMWAPSRVSVPFGYQPHLTQHVDPETGTPTRMIAVPAARYEGNEDGRGGYGAFLYDTVMDAYLPDNNAADRPMFVMLHHDGDNFGGGSEGYYHGNFQNMVNWVQNDPDYEVSTVDDYLARFPVPSDAVIHIEDGSWAGADSGDPEFKKWLGGDVSAGGLSPDLNSWAAIVAATNSVYRLEQTDPVNIESPTELNHILNKTGDPVHRAWSWLLNGQASDYWYWDGTEVWDSNPTRASNEAVAIASTAIASSGTADLTAPTIFQPQREPYNPGAIEFGSITQPSDFEVWSLVDDHEGLASVTLKWRADSDGQNPLASVQNETYAGGAEVGAWQSVPMTASVVPTPAGVMVATRKALRYGAMITGQNDVLIDYYIEATDTNGNIAKSPISHVWVGANSVDPGDRVTVTPEPLVAGGTATIEYNAADGPLGGAGTVFLHYGFDGWSPTISPDPAMRDPDGDQLWTITVPIAANASVFDFVFTDGSGTWDNNGGVDWHIPVSGGEPVESFEIDGQLDSEAQLLATNAGLSIRAALLGDTLYLATEPAASGTDRFIFLAENPGAPAPHPWGKAGTVAQWDAYIGNEGDNNWAGWFGSSAQVASGAVLETAVNLVTQFGAVPDSIYLAVASYGTDDGAGMLAQVPVSSGNPGSIDDIEYLEIQLCELGTTCCPADLFPAGNPDGALNFFDLGEYLNQFGSQAPSADLFPVENPDGVFNFFDLGAYLDLFSQGCP